MDRSSQIIRTSWIGIIANVLLAAFKAGVGVLASSVAIVMDAVNNLSDALSSVITIVGTKLSQRPADRKHPFGFGRIEYFSAIIIAVIVLSAGVTSLIESVKKIIEPTEPSYTTVTLIVIIVAIVVKLVLGKYVKSQGEKLKSDALIASGSDALFDAIITLATLVSAGVMLLWHVSLDGKLLGAKISPELLSQIKKEVNGFDGVHGVFDIIVHNYGPDVQIGSLHINVVDTMDAHQIHGLTRRISEEMFDRHGIIMTVGVYAIATGENKRAQLQHTLMQAAAAHEHVEQVHGFYYFEDEHRVSIDVVPDITIHDDGAFIQELVNELQPLVPDDKVSIVIDHNYSE